MGKLDNAAFPKYNSLNNYMIHKCLLIGFLIVSLQFITFCTKPSKVVINDWI